MEFTGKTIVVTGAAGALGAAVCTELANRGACLALMGRRADALSERAAGLPGKHATFALDLTDRPAVADAVRRTCDSLGDPWALCALAGAFAMGPSVHDSPPELWRDMWQANVGTLLPVLAEILPRLHAAGGGRVVTVGAAAATSGKADMAAYCATKSAVMRITESAAAEGKTRGITVNAVLPTILDTPANREAMPQADPAKWVATSDLARIIAFLVGEASRDITGALIPVG